MFIKAKKVCYSDIRLIANLNKNRWEADNMTKKRSINLFIDHYHFFNDRPIIN